MNFRALPRREARRRQEERTRRDPPLVLWAPPL